MHVLLGRVNDAYPEDVLRSAVERREAAKIAALSRHRGTDDPEVIDRRAAYKTDRLAEHIAKVVSEAPPLTPEQCDRLATLLRGSAA